MNQPAHVQSFSLWLSFRRCLMIAAWFMFLTFPILAIRIDTLDEVVVWKWQRSVVLGLFVLLFTMGVQLYRYWADTRACRQKAADRKIDWHKVFANHGTQKSAVGLLVIFTLSFPLVFDTYQTNIMTTALMYVVLGLGLNIVVGIAGLLDLGFVAFYAVGAYSYALLNTHFDVSFWIALPLGGLLAAVFGIILGFPVLRLRGDYLAIVTLGFGEIIRLVLENWGSFSKGPSGISAIDRPGFFSVRFDTGEALTYLYYLVLILVVVTIFAVRRLHDSRLGRAWLALREDEIACQAMGIDKAKTKLTAFALGAFWAGLMGVVFAGKTTFINPASFTFLESAIILSIVVLGGMGSIIGVIIAALILILLPEYLRALSEYRMLVFGAMMVIMMRFRPQGLIPNTLFLRWRKRTSVTTNSAK